MTEVAKMAGVSIATVSRCINGTSPVNEETAARIRACMKELGFEPNRGGRVGARGGKNAPKNVMFLSLTHLQPAEMYRMPALPSLLAGVQGELAAIHSNLMLFHSPGGSLVPPALAAKQIDGVILYGKESTGPSPALARLLHQVPVVMTFRGHREILNDFDHVTYDNRAVGPLAVRHFQERGYTHVGFVSPSTEHLAFRRRQEGFREACRKAGIRVTEYVREIDTGEGERARLGQAVVDALREKERPRGLFCVSDDVMLVIFNALERNGMHPGNDVELIGCNNDSSFLGQMSPRPATIDIMLDEVGKRVVDQLHWRMRNPLRPLVEILVKPTIVPAQDVE